MAEKYILEMTRESASVIARACEFYMRMRNGQFDELDWEMRLNEHKKGVEYDSDLFTAYLNMARGLLFPQLSRNSHYGVGHDHDGDMAWEAYEVLRHAIAWHEHPEGGCTVNFDKPMNWSGEEMPKCRIEETVFKRECPYRGM